MPRTKKTFRKPNGYGTVYNLGGHRRKPWVAKIHERTEYAPNLKKKYRQVYKTLGYFETEEEANLCLLNFKSDPTKFIDESKINELTFKNIFDLWSEQKFKNLSKSSITKYKWAYSKFAELYDVPFAKIKLIHLQTIVDKEKLAKGSLHKYTTLLHQMYAYAMMNDIVNKDYSIYIKVNNYIRDKASIHKPFTKNEIETLWSNLNALEGVETVLMMIYGGYRPSELLDIKISDVNFELNVIKGGMKTDAGKGRIVPIHSKVLPLVKSLYKKSNKYLVCDKNGKHMTYAHYRTFVFNPLMQRLGFNHLPHDGRHSFATLLSNSDANKTSIKKMIGHANYKTTEDTYIHKDIDELKKAIEKIDL
ncbi:tyrosine-type recombinase/integrase [Amedibacillus sp. YH-ame6]